jgi:hypothetical protein
LFKDYQRTRENAMKKKIMIFIFLILGAFLYHQYKYAGPYDTFLRKEQIDPSIILENLKRWRYHSYVWFEAVPDAFTTLFKRLGMGGWTETGHRVCVEGCPYWTELWTDGFHTVDLELEKMSIDGSQEVVFEEPRYIDIETWGSIRVELEKRKMLPQMGNKLKICGPLRIDRPYYVYTIQPDHAEEYQMTGTCESFPKESKMAMSFVSKKNCEQIGSMTLFQQIGLIDALTDEEKTESVTQAIEKSLSCVNQKVLTALATDGDVYNAVLNLAPSVREKLPPLKDDPKKREGNPVMNTISDLSEKWFHYKIQP